MAEVYLSELIQSAFENHESAIRLHVGKMGLDLVRLDLLFQKSR